ncbi:MAG TPA: hypothetical protein VK668_10135 [Mucilaginibacter sp.]|nr:hypothetical protein [Mucilaginibacter sp.]
MKNSFKTGFLATAIIVSLSSCGDGDRGKSTPVDSGKTSIDTSKKDIDTAKTTVVDTVKKDSVKK